MTYENLEAEVLTYIENCDASGIVELYNHIFDCEAEVEWDGSDDPNVSINQTSFDFLGGTE